MDNPSLLLAHDADAGQVNLFRLGAVANKQDVPEGMHATEAGMEVVLARPPKHLLAVNAAKLRCDVAAVSDVSPARDAVLALSSTEAGTRILPVRYDTPADAAEVVPPAADGDVHLLPSASALCVTADGTRVVIADAANGIVRVVDAKKKETIVSFFDFALPSARPVTGDAEADAGLVPRPGARRVVQSLNRAALMGRRERLRNHQQMRHARKRQRKVGGSGSVGSMSGSGDERYSSLSAGSGGESDGGGGPSEFMGDTVADASALASAAGLQSLAVSVVATSADGRWLACAGGGGMAHGPLASARAVAVYDLKRLTLHGVLPMLNGGSNGGDAPVTHIAFGASALLRAPASDGAEESAATLICVARASNAVHVYVAETLAVHPWCKYRPTPRALLDMPGALSSVSFRPPRASADGSGAACDTLFVASPAALGHVRLHPRGRVASRGADDDAEGGEALGDGTAGSRRRRRRAEQDGVYIVPLDEPCLFGAFTGHKDALLVEANFDAAVAASGAAAPASRKRFGE